MKDNLRGGVWLQLLPTYFLLNMLRTYRNNYKDIYGV